MKGGVDRSAPDAGGQAAAEDEIAELCRRILGSQAGPVTLPARQERIDRVAAAVKACRTRPEVEAPVPPPGAPVVSPVEAGSLAEAVAAELAAANHQLPRRQREALALRELLGLTHAQIATVLELDSAAVAALLARSRLGLRAQLRGGAVELEGCPDPSRALRLLAQRQDAERLSSEDDAWVREHLAACAACDRAHAAMLEAAVCYRGWEPGRP